jgi:hypothetical protein
MSYIRKTYDVYDLVTDYGYGPEAECTYNTQAEMRADFKRYVDEKKAGYLPNLLYVTCRTRRVRKENI